ncbi:MAG: formylglycine-generating enzyme family protein, partial [Chlamydiota bacterium]
QVFEKNPALLTFEEKEVLKTLQRSIPTLFGNLKMELLNLPKFLFPEIRQNLGKYVQEFPLEELAAFIQKRVKASSEIVAPSPWEMPALPEEAPVKTEKVEISQPSIIIPSINPEVLFEELMVAETQLNEIGKVYPHHVGGRREVEGRGKEMVGAQGALAVISTKEFKEQVKVPPMPPEFSTDIPFAFIVPYVPNTPIHTPPPEVKITPHDPMKEPLKEDSGDRKKKSVQMFAYVPEGEAWIGDPAAEGSVKKLLLPSYAIGVYLVTNQQFADFLTEQSKLKGISVGDRGQIFSKDKGLLLCQIKSGTVESDIEVEPQENYLSFSVISEKESYPVVCVTYDGAKAFCLAGGFRLPTEVEWEKAASLEMTEKNKVNKKFTFGCSQDEITPAFANYGTKSSSSLETFTTPVGFYNGKSSFMKEGLLIQTFDARSPFGCYDMSGNVWEWVEGENGNPLIKGGCFLSGEEDLKVFLKKEKSANSLDGYTGFRVALS